MLLHDVASDLQYYAVHRPPEIKKLAMSVEQIRNIVAQHARLSVKVEELADTSDLYGAGLTSLTTVNLMLALEDHFNVEFTDAMLGRKTFGSIQSLSEAIEELAGR